MGSLDDDDAAPFQDLDIIPAIVVGIALLGAMMLGSCALYLLVERLIWSLT